VGRATGCGRPGSNQINKIKHLGPNTLV
jgi:hypothetical protein